MPPNMKSYWVKFTVKKDFQKYFDFTTICIDLQGFGKKNIKNICTEMACKKITMFGKNLTEISNKLQCLAKNYQILGNLGKFSSQAKKENKQHS